MRAATSSSSSSGNVDASASGTGLTAAAARTASTIPAHDSATAPSMRIARGIKDLVDERAGALGRGGRGSGEGCRHDHRVEGLR
jgi:hypothetical protein